AEPNQLFTTYLDLRAVDLAAVEPYPPMAAAADLAGAALPKGAAALIHVDEGVLVAATLSDEARQAGVIITTLAQAASEQSELLRGLIEGGASLPADDAFGQVTRALSSLGLVIYVPDGVSLGRPIVLRWSHGAPGYALVSRTIVRLGRDAHITLFEEQVASDQASQEAGSRADAIWWGSTEIDLADGATLDFAGEQDFGPGTAAFVSRQARVGRNATINWAIASVGSRLHRSRIENLLEGRGATVRQVEIGFGDGKQLFDLTSYTRHRGEDTTSDLLSKGVFTGSSRGYIKGLIDIARSAKGTDTFLGEFSMLLQRSARSVTIPSLEIDQPDVRRAMHSSSVGPIDENQVFYLMSRGLSREAARKAIVLGFLEPVVARIPLPEAQDRLRGLLERKWPEGASRSAAA
ncbi:MAG TPA: SufD family Fe-S cluster assembly protein, partial [Candidatus Limnocylindrales bacterium]|nr:SufD family Fe-S cluster assembly protein [Candidatus Limnocylindrales bacterium]